MKIFGKEITKQNTKAFLQAFWNSTKQGFFANYKWLFLSAALLVLDLVSKGIISSTFYYRESREIIPSFLHFTYTHNTGASFSILEGRMVFFLIITPIILCVFFGLLFHSCGTKKVYKIALSMVIAGALGNYIDRAIFGYVRDFIEIEYFGLDLGFLGKSFAIFNVADMCIVGGIIAFSIYFSFFLDKHRQAYKKQKMAEQQAQIDEQNISQNLDENAAQKSEQEQAQDTQNIAKKSPHAER